MDADVVTVALRRLLLEMAMRPPGGFMTADEFAAMLHRHLHDVRTENFDDDD